MPPFGPRRATGKRNTPEELEDSEDHTYHTIDSTLDSPSNDIDDTLCRVAAGHNPAAVLDEAVLASYDFRRLKLAVPTVRMVGIKTQALRYRGALMTGLGTRKVANPRGT